MFARYFSFETQKRLFIATKDCPVAKSINNPSLHVFQVKCKYWASMQAWTMTHASYAPQATHHTWQFHSSHPLWPFSIANKIDLVSRSNLSAEINNSQHNLLFSSCGSRVKIFLIYLWVNLSSFHISIYCVTFVQILRSFLPFKQAVCWGQHDFCSLLSVKFAKTIFMQNYVGPIYLHIRKPIVCKIPPLSLPLTTLNILWTVGIFH